MLTKFFNYLFRRIKSDGFKSFIHFFATFSGIFLIMTVMILQILSYGVYSNVDSSLKAAVTKANSYLEMEMLKREFFLTSDVDQNNTATIYQEYDSKALLDKISNLSVYKTKSKKTKSKIEDAPHDLTVAANTSVLVLDKNGKVLNVVDKFSSLSNLPIDKNTIDVISKGSAQNYFDQTENYRLITEKVDNSFYPDAKYVVIAINTTQLEEATERYVKLIVIMMSFFGYYLSRLVCIWQNGQDDLHRKVLRSRRHLLRMLATSCVRHLL